MGRGCNGSEFIAYALPDWLQEKAIKTIYITPDSPWENPHIKSFHDKFWDELLNRELFNSLLEAKVLIEAWRIEYNQSSSHSSLGYQPLGEFAASCAMTPLRATPSAPSQRNKSNRVSGLSVERSY